MAIEVWRHPRGPAAAATCSGGSQAVDGAAAESRRNPDSLPGHKCESDPLEEGGGAGFHLPVGVRLPHHSSPARSRFPPPSRAEETTDDRLATRVSGSRFRFLLHGLCVHVPISSVSCRIILHPLGKSRTSKRSVTATERFGETEPRWQGNRISPCSTRAW